MTAEGIYFSQVTIKISLYLWRMISESYKKSA